MIDHFVLQPLKQFPCHNVLNNQVHILLKAHSDSPLPIQLLYDTLILHQHTSIDYHLTLPLLALLLWLYI